MFRPLTARFAKLFKNAQKPTRPANKAVRFAIETLEDRVVPAQYTQTGANLTINLNTNELLTVTHPAANTNVFTLTNGTFIQSGGTAATGDGTPIITVPDANLAT